jgi:hypothetical protein
MSDDLDPQDWESFRQRSHEALDGMIDFLRNARERPVWREAPAEIRNRFEAPLPRAPRDFVDVLEDFDTHIKPFAVGNTHPLFMGWVHGAGTPVGMIAEMLAGGLNANCGGRNISGSKSNVRSPDGWPSFLSFRRVRAASSSPALPLQIFSACWSRATRQWDMIFAAPA